MKLKIARVTDGKYGLWHFRDLTAVILTGSFLVSLEESVVGLSEKDRKYKYYSRPGLEQVRGVSFSPPSYWEAWKSEFTNSIISFTYESEVARANSDFYASVLQFISDNKPSRRVTGNFHARFIREVKVYEQVKKVFPVGVGAFHRFAQDKFLGESLVK